MSRDFDVLYEWLGIPPEEQPPDHYRLLGLRAFEADPAAIAEAARRQIAQVEKLGGQRPAHARAVIERLRAAERSLKTPETKAAYDRSLRERTAGAATPTTLPGAGAKAPAIQWRRWLVGLACGAAVVIVVGVSASRHRAKPGEAALPQQTAAVTPNSSKQPRALTAQQQATGDSASNQQPPAETPPAAVADKGAGPRAAGVNGWPPAWLQLDERGEPCQATLADGTVLKLDAYGKTYEAWRVAPYVEGQDCEAVIDYERDGLGGDCSIVNLRLDAAAQKMYWIQRGPSRNEHILCAGMDGTDPVRVLTLASPKLKRGVQQARGLSIDSQRGKMYWGANAGGVGAFGKGPAAKNAIWQAGLDGSDANPLFGALTSPDAIAIEPDSGAVYYFDDLRLMRGSADGGDEAVVIERLALGDNQGFKASCAVIDSEHGKIFWSGDWGIARANLDGTGFERVLDGCSVRGISLDSHNGEMYWHTNNKEVWRANVDGSHPELLVLRVGGTVIDVDSESGSVFFGDGKLVKGHWYPMIRRLKFPPPPVRETAPAPPIVFSIDPPRQRAGAKVEVRGAHFSGVAAVRVIGDDGRQSDAEFTVADDAKLTFVLPPRREGVNRLAIVVQGPGGVTVTLPHETHAVTNRDGPFFRFDRTRDAGKFCFAVSQDARLVRVENSLVYAPTGASVSAEGRGNVVLFLKDGSRSAGVDATGIVVYHEPYARIFGRATKHGDHEYVRHQYIPVLAIRPSFVESLLEYEQAE